MKSLIVLLALASASPSLMAQRLDPDTCLTCVDSRQHFAAGAGIDLASRLVAKRAWQRVAIVVAVGAAYEAGQMSAAADAGLKGPGYGFGLKDLALDAAGAVVAEGIVWLVRKI